MKLIVTIGTVVHNEKPFSAGETLEIEDADDAQRLIRLGVAEPAKRAEKSKEKAAPEKGEAA